MLAPSIAKWPVKTWSIPAPREHGPETMPHENAPFARRDRDRHHAAVVFGGSRGAARAAACVNGACWQKESSPPEVAPPAHDPPGRGQLAELNGQRLVGPPYCFLGTRATSLRLWACSPASTEIGSPRRAARFKPTNTITPATIASNGEACARVLGEQEALLARPSVDWCRIRTT